MEELSQKADLIVRGTVIEVTSQFTQDLTAIQTTIRVSVQEQWKGKPLSSLTFTQPGGSVGEIVEETPGLPHFQPSENVVLFLKETDAGKFAVLGGEQGVFALKTDSSGEKEVVESFTGEAVPLAKFACHVKKVLGGKDC